ncbi:MAG: glycosyltransferase family 2 protein [Bacteroidales bacterium]|jgi:cellulose synthase/poly-beta-1,6-N-acetylglucosamine synthase-like glycosyltransferase|nr:glycosyltransferase family 2 protein [Bacteroidales bacterium]
MIFLKAIFFLITGYFLFCVLYVFFFSMAGLFYKNPVFPKAKRNRKIAILVPAYKANGVIEELADNVLRQEYPDYDLIIIADSLNADVLERLRKKPVKVMEFSDPNRTKALALNTIMGQLPDHAYEVALILDSDNLIKDPDYLSCLNDAFEAGCQVVQTHRTSKNRNTPIAFLDAVSEEINNHIFRRGHAAVSLSTALIGSAMAFDYQLYKNGMKLVKTSGEDRELEINLLRKKIRFTYVDRLPVLDEKTQEAGVFVDQRGRWIANQLLQARTNIAEAFCLLFHGNIDFFDKVIQQFLLPRILMLALMTVFTIFVVIFMPAAYSAVWLLMDMLLIISLLLDIPKNMFGKTMIKAVLYLPQGAFLMFSSLFKLKGATKKFHATEHRSIPGEVNQQSG